MCMKYMLEPSLEWSVARLPHPTMSLLDELLGTGGLIQIQVCLSMYTKSRICQCNVLQDFTLYQFK